MIIDEEAYLAHYGILRKSGRYPWGSGGNQISRNRSFLQMVDDLKRKGMSEPQIAESFGIKTTELRAAKSIARSEVKQADISMAQRMHDKGMSNVAIGKRMGINESSVRALLAPGQKHKADVLESTSNFLKDQVKEKGFVDVGVGVEHYVQVSRTRLDVAIARLREEGYELHTVQVPQLGTNQKTAIKVLCPPGTKYQDVKNNKDKIQSITGFTEDGGITYHKIQPPLSISSKRIAVRYKEEGGDAEDGVIYIRPNVPDISLGGTPYAQVRIAVDGTHYMKGMAMYKDDLPPGVDLLFNTNKSSTGNKLDAMKPIKDDEGNPFGSIVHQRIDPKTGKVTSAMNIVGTREGSGEEGSWAKWSNALSSQFLSKQSPSLARSQLNMTYERKTRELADIMALTNPTVRKKLLEEFADSADSSSVHLKAAALPRQRNSVILPMNTMKEGEIYAPQFKNGERVVLVRHPHGGIFEIPELVVNNRNPTARRLLGNAEDAVGIHSKVAAKLSGADFDGDTVLVIPNDKGLVKTAPSLAGLKGFDPQMYKIPADSPIPRMTPRTKGIEMGKVSNLITDMTLKGAPQTEIARAVKHSMVVIDAEKHHLNYKQSAIDNGIPELMRKYQEKSTGGASTLISRAKSEIRVPQRQPRSAAKGGPVDKETGKKVFDEPVTFVNRQGQTITKTRVSTKLAETDDAHTLVSKPGTLMERIYADHSNRLKNLADTARKEAVNTKATSWSPSAKKVYAQEVADLEAKLNIALRNAPKERAAQVVGNAIVAQKMQANPDMEKSEIKKIKALALEEARIRTGASKTRITITDKEWDAIQAGAISNNKLEQILDNADTQRVRELATPRTSLLMTPAKQQRAAAMFANGYTQAEVADALGVSLTTLKNNLG